MIVISDTSPLRYLIETDLVHILETLFGSVRAVGWLDFTEEFGLAPSCVAESSLLTPQTARV